MRSGKCVSVISFTKGGCLENLETRIQLLETGERGEDIFTPQQGSATPMHRARLLADSDLYTLTRVASAVYPTQAYTLALIAAVAAVLPVGRRTDLAQTTGTQMGVNLQPV